MPERAWGFKSPLRHSTQSEILFRALPFVAAGYRVETTGSDVLEGGLALCGTFTSLSWRCVCPGERWFFGGVCRFANGLLTAVEKRAPFLSPDRPRSGDVATSWSRGLPGTALGPKSHTDDVPVIGLSSARYVRATVLSLPAMG